MPEQGFDKEAYAKRLEQMSDAELSEHFRGIDSETEPERWRIAYFTVKQRGITVLPARPKPKSSGRDRNPALASLSEIGYKNGKKTPLLIAVKSLLSWTAIVSIFGFIIWHVMTVISGVSWVKNSLITELKNSVFSTDSTQVMSYATSKGIYSVVEYGSSGREDSAQKDGREKRVGIFASLNGGKRFILPPENGGMFVFEGILYVVSDKEVEYTNALLADGTPADKWTDNTPVAPIGVTKLDCYTSYFFPYGQSVYRLMKYKGDSDENKCNKRESDRIGDIAIFDYFSGERMAGEFERAFAEHDSGEPIEIFEVGGKLYLIRYDYGENWNLEVIMREFNGISWSNEQILSDAINTVMYKYSDGNYLYIYGQIRNQEGENDSKSRLLIYDGSNISLIKCPEEAVGKSLKGAMENADPSDSGMSDVLVNGYITPRAYYDIMRTLITTQTGKSKEEIEAQLKKFNQTDQSDSQGSSSRIFIVCIAIILIGSALTFKKRYR